MAKYTIAEKKVTDLSEKNLEKYYSEAKTKISDDKGEYPKFDFSDLDYVFKVACDNRELFPKINIETKDDSIYINRWVLSYCNAISNPQSKKVAVPKTSCSDPIVKKIAKISKSLSCKEASEQEKAHILFMSAENVLGNLLEEYIASHIRKYGWIWCAGETLHAIDFCSLDGKILLQIKNKNNTENSSSSKVRKGTKIKKWYRLSTSNKDGLISPKYHWDTLNKIINDAKKVTVDEKGNPLPKCSLSEEDFSKYIDMVVNKNKGIVTDK